MTPTALLRGTRADSVSVQDVPHNTRDRDLTEAARAYVKAETGYPSRDQGASINRYPATASAVVILWKD